MLTAAELMTPNPVLVRHDAPLVECAVRLSGREFRHVPVVDDEGVLLGVVFDFDIFARGALTLGSQPVWMDFDPSLRPAIAADVACPPAVTAKADDPLSKVLADMLKAREDIVVVVDDEGRPVGVITEHDVVRLAQGLVAGALTVRHEGHTPVLIDEGAAAADGWSMMLRNRFRHLLLVDVSHRLTGVLSFRDLVFAGADHRSEIPLHKIKGQRDLLVRQGEVSVAAAARLMVEHKVGCLPLVDAQGWPVAVITRQDVLGAAGAALEGEGLFPEA